MLNHMCNMLLVLQARPLLPQAKTKAALALSFEAIELLSLATLSCLRIAALVISGD